MILIILDLFSINQSSSSMICVFNISEANLLDNEVFFGLFALKFFEEIFPGTTKEGDKFNDEMTLEIKSYLEIGLLEAR